MLGIGDAVLELKGDPNGEGLRVLCPPWISDSKSSSSPDIKRRLRGRSEEAESVELVFEE